MTDEENGRKDTRRELERLLDLVRGRHYDAAVEGLRRFLDLHPKHEIANGLLASTYFQIGLPLKAQQHYERILEVNQNNALARFQLGLAFFTQREFERALEIWTPMLPVSGEFMAHFHSALAHLELKNHDAARKLLEEAAKNMPITHPLFAQLKAVRSALLKE